MEPALPSPRRETVCPSSMPAGMDTLILRWARALPEPRQEEQGVLMILPLPWQV